MKKSRTALAAALAGLLAPYQALAAGVALEAQSVRPLTVAFTAPRALSLAALSLAAPLRLSGAFSGLRAQASPRTILAAAAPISAAAAAAPALTAQKALQAVEASPLRAAFRSVRALEEQPSVARVMEAPKTDPASAQAPLAQLFEHGAVASAGLETLPEAAPVPEERPSRASGILLHVTSLPSPNIGDLGSAAYRFVDFLAWTGQRFWQVLPLTRTDPGSGNSPYSSDSAFARNTLLISPELLAQDGWLNREDLGSAPPDTPGTIDYPAVSAYKQALFDKLWQRYRKEPRQQVEFKAFKEENSSWLNDYALFVSIKRSLAQEGTWNAWPEEYRLRDPQALEAFAQAHGEDIEQLKLLQFIFAQQWSRLKAYAEVRGVELIGDIPIYVSYDSADVWAHPEYFQLDQNLAMTHVSGVPPDMFSETGQLWGTPVYAWQALAADGFRWWLERLRGTLTLVDKVRVDHFRGLVQYWRVPTNAKTAMPEEGSHWADGPGESFFEALVAAFPGAIIAEDLGVITKDVVTVMKRFLFPGMKVLQFAFGYEDEEGKKTSAYLPENHTKEGVVYTGTHDNNTTLGWLQSDATERELLNLRAYLLEHGIAAPAALEELAWEVVRLAMGSIADTVILPMQDALGLGGEGRMNKPGVAEGNWLWRMLGEPSAQAASRLRQVTESAGRAHGAVQVQESSAWPGGGKPWRIAAGALGLASILKASLALIQAPATEPTLQNLNQALAHYQQAHAPQETLIPTESDFVVVKGDFNRRFKLQDTFRTDGKIEPARNVEYPVMAMNREQGLRTLWEQVREARYEHAWAHIPGLGIWVDVSVATVGNSVLQDTLLIQALRDRFGQVEVYHSHPRPVLQRVYAEHPHVLHPAEIAGALPTGTDLMTLVSRAWEQRDRKQAEGVIHPLGVTLFLPTRTLLISGIGPPVSDVGNALYDKHADARISPQERVRRLVRAQVRANDINIDVGRPEGPAFSIAYFEPSQFPQIESWLGENLSALNEKELARVRSR